MSYVGLKLEFLPFYRKMQLNFILVGQPGVGKSSYISRIRNGDCCQSGTLFYKTNIGDYTLHLGPATDKPDGIILYDL